MSYDLDSRFPKILVFLFILQIITSVTKWESMTCDVVRCKYALQIILDSYDNINLVRIALKQSTEE